MPGEGRGLSSRPTQDVVRDLEIGQPTNSEKSSETADGVTRESEGGSRLSLLRSVRARGAASTVRPHPQSPIALSEDRQDNPGLVTTDSIGCTPLPRTDLVPICEVMLFAG